MNKVCVITIKVKEMEEAIAFYSGKLNFVVSEHYSETVVSLKQEPIAIVLETSQSGEVPPDNSIVLGLESVDLDKDIKILKEKGVKLVSDEPKPCPPGRFIEIEDPSGKKLEVLEFWQ
ncbi:VOC family protein [Sediminibacillus halophilus]|uniref:Catechol 2,3-dioxygenase n=1 Tax=Sediminibacillus halophilus TaxID=482461 RepID=A0A1G9LPM1_9BACI|nr:VOC family protein [Sediminibacillus halophilus]SDL63880.1 Catechol 2,3-dioxygenase [Sediminibacillus halophilus]